jgi:hypothetical protein
MEQKVFVVYVNNYIVGVFTSQAKAIKATAQVDPATTIGHDYFADGPQRISIQIYTMDQVYHPSTYKSISVPSKQIQKHLIKAKTQAPKKRGRPKKTATAEPK